MALYHRRLRDIREDHALTQKQAAARLGIDQTVSSIYKRGKRETPTRHFIQLAEFYQISTDYMLGRTNDPTLSTAVRPRRPPLAQNDRKC